MSTKPIACAMCHGSGYTVAGIPCSCGAVQARLTAPPLGITVENHNFLMDSLKAEITSLRQQLQEAKKDADRYQFLIKAGQTAKGTFLIDCLAPSYLQFEAAIDAAIAKEKTE